VRAGEDQADRESVAQLMAVKHHRLAVFIDERQLLAN
jgi:hypothetical protein